MGVIKKPRSEDPRVVRTRAAVVGAARTLFLQKGYAGTTMEEVAALAGLTKRTVYNNYADKDALFTEIVRDTIAYAEAFALHLDDEFIDGTTSSNVHASLSRLGRRLALGIVRPEVIALRRLLIGEAREFPALAQDYFTRAPGQVLDALTRGFRRLDRAGVLRAPNPRRASAQFAYLVAGETLDRALMTGTLPSRTNVTACASDGVLTFLARYAVESGHSPRP